MRISIEEVKPGMITLTPVFNNKGVIIIGSKKALTKSLISGLLKNNIKEIEVEEYQAKPADVGQYDLYTTISDELKRKSINSLKQLNISEIINNANEIVGAILRSKEFSYNLIDYKADNDVYGHSVRVAAFTSVLAKYFNQELASNQHINLEDLSIASLVHDLGKTLKESSFKISLANLPSVFNEKLPGMADAPIIGYDENFEQLYTFCLLNQFADINNEIKLSVLLSGENENETGPLKAKKELMSSKSKLVIMAKMIHLCSMYDNLLEKTIKNNEPLENISTQLETYAVNGILDKEITDLFIKHVPLYSVGINVKLSDGRTAVVIETFTERVNNYKPIVITIPTCEIIDLRNETTLTVQEICNKNISFSELVTRQIIDMNNGITCIEQTEGRQF